MKVLLVESSFSKMENVAAQLECRGIETVKAFTNHQAQRVLQCLGPFDWIVTTDSIPNGDGIEFARVVKILFPKTKVILVVDEIKVSIRKISRFHIEKIIKGWGSVDLILGCLRRDFRQMRQRKLEVFEKRWQEEL